MLRHCRPWSRDRRILRAGERSVFHTRTFHGRPALSECYKETLVTGQTVCGRLGRGRVYTGWKRTELEAGKARCISSLSNKLCNRSWARETAFADLDHYIATVDRRMNYHVRQKLAEIILLPHTRARFIRVYRSRPSSSNLRSSFSNRSADSLASSPHSSIVRSGQK